MLTDIKACNEFAQADSKQFRRMLYFVCATIQQQLETVPAIMQDFDYLGTDSRHAFGFKRKLLAYVDTHGAQLHADALTAKHDPERLLELFCAVPGLGLVKAGFACQLFSNRVGCIDSHNIQLYSIPLNKLRYRKEFKPTTLAAKRTEYIALCAGLGGSELLWQQWCMYVAKLRPYNWSDWHEVSIFHPECLTGKFKYSVPELFDTDSRPAYNRGSTSKR